MADEARCERCGAAFHCGAGDAQPCACTRITLDAAALQRLRQTFRGCLCLDCLAQIQREAATSVGAPSA